MKKLFILIIAKFQRYYTAIGAFNCHWCELYPINSKSSYWISKIDAFELTLKVGGSNCF